LTEDLTTDAFLGGRIRLLQPRNGYRAGVDPVLLAAAVPARAGQTLLELGCGVGAASLCLQARVPGLTITGVEVQPDYAALARRNATAAGSSLQVITADLRDLPADLRQMTFDHVFMNPPYFDRDKGTRATDAGRDIALGGATPLADWLDVAIRRLAPKGHLTLIQQIARLPEVLAHIRSHVGSVVVLPIVGRDGAAAGQFLLQARHSGRAPFRMLAPLVLHTGKHHLQDADDYTPQVAAILRNGAGLSLSD
jgi:tRNA1(Val) A37 N6-methylase TrmN6